MRRYCVVTTLRFVSELAVVTNTRTRNSYPVSWTSMFDEQGEADLPGGRTGVPYRIR